MKLTQQQSAVLALFLSSSVQGQTPTKKSIKAVSGNTFPNFVLATADLVDDAVNKLTVAASQYDTTAKTLQGDALKNNDGAGDYSGIVGAFRMRNSLAFPAMVNFAQTNSGSNADTYLVSVTNVGTFADASQGRTYYETNKTTRATTSPTNFAVLFGISGNSGTKDEKVSRNGDMAGFKEGVCPSTKFSTADGPKTCGLGVTWGVDSTPIDNDNNKHGCWKGRQIFGIGADPSATTTCGQGAASSTGGIIETTTKYLAFNEDIVLASFYQSNGALAGTATDTWCYNGNAAGSETNFQTMLAADTAVDFAADKGIGPKTKCTWQFTVPAAELGKKAPAFSLESSPNVYATLQVIEWYNLADFATGTEILTYPGTTNKSPIGNVNAYNANGVYLSPFTTSVSANFETMTSTTGLTTTDPMNEESAVDNEAGSIGTAMYHDVTTGGQKGTIRSVDSLWVTRAYEGYNAAKTAYTQAKTDYDTEGAKYTAGTITDKPKYPGTFAAYSGPSWQIANYKAATGKWSDLDTAKLTTTSTQVQPYLAQTNASGYGGAAEANVKKYNNRYSYLQNHATDVATGLVVCASGTTANCGKDVSHVFGKLGQAGEYATDATTSIAQPFIWQDAIATAEPTMQITLLPEFANVNWQDWSGFDASNYFKAKVIRKTALTPADFAAPTAPGAPTVLADVATTGAIALGASIASIAVVASTLF